MKRIMAVVVVMAFIATMFCGVSFAGSNTRTYVIKNTSGVYLTTVIPQVAIPHGRKIMGFDIQGNSLSSENVIAVYDETVGTLTGECLGEAEALPETVDGKWIPDGRTLMYGCTVRQGPNTTAFVYFE